MRLTRYRFDITVWYLLTDLLEFHSGVEYEAVILNPPF